MFILTDEQKATIEKRARAPLESQLWRVHVGWKGSEFLGYAVLDTHVVRTLPETFMVVMAPDGAVRRVEILAFYEPPEYVPPARWKQQFEGRRLDDDLRLGDSIQGITGSTLSATGDDAGRASCPGAGQVADRAGSVAGEMTCVSRSRPTGRTTAAQARAGVVPVVRRRLVGDQRASLLRQDGSHARVGDVLLPG